MQLQLSSWPEVSAYLKRKSILIVPVGSTEQHGPSGFVGTDALCPQGVAAAAGQESQVMVAPVCSYGMAQHHLGFPGTAALRPSTMIALVTDLIASWSRNGFDRFYFLNGHGGNIATLSAAFSEIYAQKSFADADRPHIRCHLRNWWDGARVKRLASELCGSQDGSHATCAEIAMTYYLYPDHVKHAEFDPPTAPDGPIYDAEDFARRFPDGRMGSNPSLVTVEAGEKLFQAAVADVVDDLASVFRN